MSTSKTIVQVLPHVAEKQQALVLSSGGHSNPPPEPTPRLSLTPDLKHSNVLRQWCASAVATAILEEWEHERRGVISMQRLVSDP